MGSLADRARSRSATTSEMGSTDGAVTNPHFSRAGEAGRRTAPVAEGHRFW